MIDLERLEQYRENNRIEAKRALGGLPRSLWETYSAFANTLGGVLLLGVEEYRDRTLHTVDLPDPRRLVREFWTIVNDPARTSANILSEDDVRVEEVNGDHIILITVPRASRFLRPVYVDGDPLRGCYRRSGEGDMRCTAEEADAMRRAAAVSTPDTELLEKTELAALCPDSVRACRLRRETFRPGSRVPREDPAMLAEMGAAAMGRDGRLHPTGAGLLMFGYAAEIRRLYPLFSLRCRGGGEDISTGTGCENIYDFYVLVSERLAPLGDEPVRRALEEALGNCLINADYHGRRGVEIRLDRRGVEMTNPGAFRLGLDSAIAGGRSEPCNGGVMRIFCFIGVGQGLGGGIPGIFALWRTRGWGEPAIRPEPGLGSVTISLPLGPERAPGGTRKAEGQAAIRKAARREQLLQYLTDHPSATAGELARELGIRPSGAQTMLRELAEAGLVTPEEKNGETSYRLKA